MGVVYIPAGRDASWILKSWQSPQLLLRLTQWPENKLPSLHPRERERERTQAIAGGEEDGGEKNANKEIVLWTVLVKSGDRE